MTILRLGMSTTFFSSENIFISLYDSGIPPFEFLDDSTRTRLALTGGLLGNKYHHEFQNED